jgi:hypothetical protein
MRSICPSLFRLAALCALALSPIAQPVALASPPTAAAIVTATDAVLSYSRGYVDGYTEATALATLVRDPTNPIRFRDMAAIHRELALRFADTPLLALYLLGRASAFAQAADLAGEP